MGASYSSDWLPIENEEQLVGLLHELDTQNNGYLSLGDIAKVPKCWTFINSLPVLFYFDELKNGTLTFKSLVDAYGFFNTSKERLRDELSGTEFKELLNRGVQLTKQETTDSSAHTGNGSAFCRFANLSKVRSVFVPDDSIQRNSRRDSGLSDKANGPSVAIYGNSSDAQSENAPAENEGDTEEVEYSEHAKTTAVGERVRLKMFKELTVFLSEDGAREEFMQWLWKVTDFGRQNYVTIAELSCLFRILELGVLNQDHFIILADLITREYEYWESRHLDTVGNCELGRIIGKGATGIVRFASNMETKEKYALKIVKKGNCAYMSRLDHEIESLKMLTGHPHVVELEEVLEDDENMYLRMELLGGGSLIDIVRLYPNNLLPEEVARYYMRQLFETLECCHSLGICHRDVRLENMLLDNKAKLKLGDFGQSGVFTAAWDMFSTTLVGSVYSLSPEQVLGMCYSGRKIDVWSAGVSMYCLLVGHPPFYDLDSTDLLTSIVTGTYKTPLNLSVEAINLMSKMLNVDPDARPSFEKLLEHPWFSAGDEYPPVLDKLEIPVHPLYVRRPDLAEMIIASVLYQHKTHFHLGAVDNDALPDKVEGMWCIKCHHPSLDLKFLLTLCTRPNTLDEEESEVETGKHVQDGFAVARDSGWADLRRSHEVLENSAISRTLSQYPHKRHIATTAPGVVPQLRAQSFGNMAESKSAPNVNGPHLQASPMQTSARRAFLSVSFQEGETGAFVKLYRKLKAICDESLWEAAEKQTQRLEERNRLVQHTPSSEIGNAIPLPH
eukprot:CAMPEP_0113969974 /NCGR_PEP_ID=MMETSP0011_2-20120614/10745_1 /TAXON_ID=101924 /ORGANISM="Rhodosorus marinus" /LENGTH=783 /DNA_ID=CAMNT_0000983951 /DNA_START=400 /DNA_END=2752 /DNA_ORIENTATION=- /assembly_acc=CAM_ASM_000156